MEQDENVFTRVNTEPEARILDYAIQSPQLIGSLGTPILSSGCRPDSLHLHLYGFSPSVWFQSPQLIGSLGTPILSSGYRPDSLRQAFICPQDIVH